MDAADADTGAAAAAAPAPAAQPRKLVEKTVRSLLWAWGCELKAARIQADLTQADVAARVGLGEALTVADVALAERGRLAVGRTADVYLEIGEALDVAVTVTRQDPDLVREAWDRGALERDRRHHALDALDRRFV